jgi:hypothetical protein
MSPIRWLLTIVAVFVVLTVGGGYAPALAHGASSDAAHDERYTGAPIPDRADSSHDVLASASGSGDVGIAGGATRTCGCCDCGTACCSAALTPIPEFFVGHGSAIVHIGPDQIVHLGPGRALLKPPRVPSLSN